MATSYIANLKLPTAATWTHGEYIKFNQTDSGSASPFSSLALTLAAIKTVYEGFYGGTLSWTSVTNGSYDDYTFTYSSLTTDPTTDATNGYDIVSFSLVDDGGTYYSASWLSTTICEDAGLCRECPPSVNPDDATDCLSCYEQYAVNCETPITIQGLDASTEYVITISDNVSGKSYSYTTTTDTNGDADIDTADFPTGLFSPYNSPFTLTITENGLPVTLTYGYVNYSCISLNITNTETA